MHTYTHPRAFYPGNKYSLCESSLLCLWASMQWHIMYSTFIADCNHAIPWKHLSLTLPPNLKGFISSHPLIKPNFFQPASYISWVILLRFRLILQETHSSLKSAYVIAPIAQRASNPAKKNKEFLRQIFPIFTLEQLQSFDQNDRTQLFLFTTKTFFNFSEIWYRNNISNCLLSKSWFKFIQRMHLQ